MQINDLASLYINDPSPINAERLYVKARNVGRRYYHNYFGNARTLHEDALSLSLLKMLTRIETFDPAKSQFTTWFHAVCKNEMLQAIKKMRNKKEEEMPEEFELIDAPTNSEAKQRLLDLADDIIAYMRSDERRHRCHIDYVEGMSYDEIAEKHCINLNTVKTRINRSRRMLEERFATELNNRI